MRRSCNDCNALVDEGLGSTDGEGIPDACDSCPLDPLNDADGDGACGDVDECADSDLRPILVIAGCETGVPSTLYHTGCTLQDLVNNCGVGAANHGRFASCIAELSNDLKKQDLLTGRRKGRIQRCAT